MTSFSVKCVINTYTLLEFLFIYLLCTHNVCRVCVLYIKILESCSYFHIIRNFVVCSLTKLEKTGQFMFFCLSKISTSSTNSSSTLSY